MFSAGFLQVWHNQWPQTHKLDKASTSDGIFGSPVIIAKQSLDWNVIQSQCPAFSNLVTIKSVMKMGLTWQTQMMTPFEGTNLTSANRKLGTLWAFVGIQCPDSSCMPQPVRGKPQKKGNYGGRVTNGSSHWCQHVQLSGSIHAETV